MLYDSFDLKPYIYVLLFQKLVHLCPIYVLLLGFTPYPSIIRFSSGFQVPQKLLREFVLDMSGLWPGHIRPSGFRVYI
jgi:hypothetical protein